MKRRGSGRAPDFRRSAGPLKRVRGTYLETPACEQVVILTPPMDDELLEELEQLHCEGMGRYGAAIAHVHQLDEG